MRPFTAIRTALLALVAALGLFAIAGAGTATAAPGSVAVDFVGRTHLESIVSPLVLKDVGTVKGSPIGSGDIVTIYSLHPETGIATTTFTITNENGTVSGNCTSKYTVGNLHFTFTGTANITGGTGAYSGMRAKMLQFNALHSVTGKREVIEFTGRATTPSRVNVNMGLKIKSKMVSANGGTKFSDKGTATGAPMGSANVALEYRLFPNANVSTIDFTLTNANGTITGACKCDFEKDGARLLFNGPTAITGGTGSYAGIAGTGLTLRSQQSATGSVAPISITGIASKPKG